MPLLDLISPDASLRHALREQIAASVGRDWNGQLAEFASLAHALEAWKTRMPGLVVVDEAALDQDVARLNGAMNAGPIPALLFVIGETGKGLDETLVTETFTKPARLGYLLARWQFYSQLQAKNRDVTVTLGPWRFTPRTRQLGLSGTDEVVKLTDKEASLLEYLCQAPAPLPRDEILAAVWGYDGDIDTHTLETHITRLRRKLAPEPGVKPEGDVFLVERGCYQINPLWLNA